MTSDELKEEISAILEQPHHTQLYLLLKENDDLIMKLANLEDNKTAPEIQRLFENFLNANIVLNDDLVIRMLSVADEFPHSIYQYDYINFPEELNLFWQFDIAKAVRTEHFDFKIDDLSHLYGYIIYIGSMEKGVILFKKHYPISLIKRDSFLLGAIKSRECFEKMDGEDIIRLNDDVQLLRLGNNIFVFDLQMMERNMGFSELMQKAATDTVEEIKKLDILEDIEVLKDTLGDMSFVRKLYKLKEASAVFRLRIKKEDIVEYTKKTPELAGIFKYSEDGKKIRLDTKKSKKEFLKLMNDAFLRSELTKQYYDVSAKDNISKS